MSAQSIRDGGASRRATKFGAVALGALLLSGTAGAQTAPDAALPAGDPVATPTSAPVGQGLGDIVVTAEKRKNTAQRTPISVAVVTPEAIARNGIGNLTDLIKILPSVQFGRNFANSIVTIRGVSSRDTDETGDPAVAISIDGFYFQRSLGINDAMFDLERVEALRGPQGTLYGRSATGGAINFITAKPEKEFASYVGATVGNYATINTEGMVNIPLADTVQVRASFATRNHDGYRHNAPARDGDDQDSQAARVHLAFQPMEHLEGLLTAEYIKTGGVGGANYGVPLAFDGSGNVIHNQPDLPKNGKRWPMGLPSGSLDIETIAFRWNFKYDFGPVQLAYLGGYRKLNFSTLIDLDGMEEHQGLYGTNTYFAPQSEKPETWNHEIRLNSTAGGIFDWQVGAYYFKESNDVYSELSYFTKTTPDVAFIFDYPHLGTESKAVFGQGSLHATDTLTVEAGMRYSKDKKWRRGSADYQAFDLFIPIDQKASWTKATYHAGVNWQATPRNLLYAKFDTGYKPGGYTDVAPYGPENIKAYEVGTKNRFFGNAVQFNLSAFYYDYSDQQVLQFVGSQTIIQNAGKSEYYGVELETVALLTNNDRIDGDVSYLHARYKEFSIAGATGNLDLAGNTPPQAPTWAGNVGYQHVFDTSLGSFTARGQTHLQTATHLQFYNYDSDRQGGYSRSDFVLTYRPLNKRWLIEGFVRNIENERVITAAQEQSLVQAYVYQFDAPRTFGARFRMDW